MREELTALLGDSAENPAPVAGHTSGFVALVGAGPGDVGLLTLRGRELLDQAQVVVYDYLANPQLLQFAPKAENIYVGKKAAQHSMSQEDINALLVKLGQAGKRVVRLKGGDPYVFGRGGEEGEALRAAGVRFEVVPGITAAIGGIAFAGLPVTHRDFNSSFTLITGHEKEQEYKEADALARDSKAGPAAGSSDVDWSALAKLPCLAFYMGAKALPRITEKLIAHGMSPDTPAATVQWASTPRQKTAVGTLATIVAKVAEAKIGAPAITLVGKVVTMRDKLNWFEQRPLFGKTVVVTRTRQQVSDLSNLLAAQGAHVIEAPTIDIGPPADYTEVDRALKSASGYDWIVFTSANGVTHTRDRLLALGLDARALGNAKIAAVGPATADAVRTHLFRKVDLCPETTTGDGLATALLKLGEVYAQRFLLLRADIARPALRDRLISGGAGEVQDISIYETHPATTLPPQLLEALQAREVHWITFTSSSTAKNFIHLLGNQASDLLKNVKLASIGPVTTATLQDLGYPPAAESTEASLDKLVAALSS